MNKNDAFSLEPNRVRQGALLVSASDETSAGAEARYPRGHTPFPVLDEAYRLALRELDLLRTEDGCWDTGALCSIQKAKTRTAMPMTAGTKMPETLSAIRAIGAFVPAASLTNRILCAKVVSSPTRVARQRR